MHDIVLTTLNAKYQHTAFGLRYLRANLAELRSRSVLVEFDLGQRALDIVESLLDREPRIIGLGVYIWNARETLEIVSLLKQLRPEVTLVLGGPEVSYETELQPICQLADFVITGEADLAFPALCRQILQHQPPPHKIIPAPPPRLADLQFPYEEYTTTDLTQRVVYVEASRGCPFHCEFCLSSLDVPVRTFPQDAFLAALRQLLDRGLLHFKFVDRTFNLNQLACQTLLQFFLDLWRPGLFLHFEVIPDRLPSQLLNLIARFPPGSLQFELGIQTFNPAVAERIHRRQDYHRTEANLQFLRRSTNVHLHTDLILGLPGESTESFAHGFDRLLQLGPHEIQVGVLKRLRGTPINRHTAEWNMVYRSDPPYDLLQNRLLPFPTLQRLRRFARAWDLTANSGNFTATLPLIWQDCPSPFQAFLSWTDWLHHTVGPLHAIALHRLTRLLFRYLTEIAGHPPAAVQQSLQVDYRRTGRGNPPAMLASPSPTPAAHPSHALRRQHRHRADPPSITHPH